MNFETGSYSRQLSGAGFQRFQRFHHLGRKSFGSKRPAQIGGARLRRSNHPINGLLDRRARGGKLRVTAAPAEPMSEAGLAMPLPTMSGADRR